MGNPPINPGMKIETYDSFVEKTAKRAAKAKNPACPDYTKQFYNGAGGLFAEAWRSESVKTENGKTIYSDRITAYDENYHYTAENKGPEVYYPDRFTRIESDTQYAVDKNRNGVVDEDEIFDK